MIAYVGGAEGIRANDDTSIGHIVVWGEFEYFAHDHAIYRANVANPIGVDGIRQGARFECMLAQWPTLRGILGIPSI
jgi:hypothetical protein